MDDRYVRNRIYISEEEQLDMKNCPLLLGGSGIGSMIAECALRLGFEDITIIDGDVVEESNLNRQNYVESDIGTFKVVALEKRLKSINPKAKIKVHEFMISTNNLCEIISGKSIAVNALDFTSDIPLLFDSKCQQANIPVLHPYNLGWGALTTVVSPKGFNLSYLQRDDEQFNELNVVEYFSSYMKFWGAPQTWLEEVIESYKSEEKKMSPPQLSVASYGTASMCAHILFNIATKRSYKIFPEFYFSSIM